MAKTDHSETEPKRPSDFLIKGYGEHLKLSNEKGREVEIGDYEMMEIYLDKEEALTVEVLGTRKNLFGLSTIAEIFPGEKKLKIEIDSEVVITPFWSHIRYMDLQRNNSLTFKVSVVEEKG